MVEKDSAWTVEVVDPAVNPLLFAFVPWIL